jgi:hypothetical protein
MCIDRNLGSGTRSRQFAMALGGDFVLPTNSYMIVAQIAPSLTLGQLINSREIAERQRVGNVPFSPHRR